MARPPQSKAAPGIFQRGQTFWLRYSVGGEQIRVSLDTSDRLEAIKRAEERRGQKQISTVTGKIRGGKTDLDRTLERYTAERQRAKITDEKGFKDGTAKGVTQAVQHFQTIMGITDPGGITSKAVSEFYRKLNGTALLPGNQVKLDTTHKKSEATARTYATRVATFARWFGIEVAALKFKGKTPARKTVIPLAKVEELLAIATGDLKFVLLAGFRAGMRRGEIVWARPSWFNLDSENPSISIPCPDPVTGWMPKTGVEREIPLVSEFADFIRATFPNWKKQAFCIRPEKQPGDWIYRFDDRKMFDGFTSKNCRELTHHVMRHSFISHLANGGVGVAQIAAWSGDKIATLERHYFHLKADAEKAEEAFAAHRKPTARQAQEAMAAQQEALAIRVAEMLEAQKASLEHQKANLVTPHPSDYTGGGVAADQGAPLTEEKIKKRRFEGE